MQIDLVSYKKKTVIIEYGDEIEYGGASYKDPMKKKSNIPPTPDFILAIGSMAVFIPDFGVDLKGVESTEVHKVEIGREKEKLTIVLHVIQKTIKTNAPFEFKTPKVHESEDAWSEEVSDAVVELMIQAEKYLAGEYAQTELEFDEPGQGAEPERMQIVRQEETEDAVAV